MISIVDLQIGNRVLYNSMDAIVYGICGPYPNKDGSFNNKATIDLILGGMITATEDELEPIVLTKNILIDVLKFEQIGEDNSFSDGGLVKIVLEDDNWDDIAFDVYFNGTYFNCISYVHELQNIYKVINNEDLIK